MLVVREKLNIKVFLGVPLILNRKCYKILAEVIAQHVAPAVPKFPAITYNQQHRVSHFMHGSVDGLAVIGECDFLWPLATHLSDVSFSPLPL